LFGDGHYDFRNIAIKDSSVVPTFQIDGETDLISRSSDIFYSQLETSDNSGTQSKINPSIAIGRIPVENELDAERMIEKLTQYKQNPIKDGWQTVATIIGDDEKTSSSSTEWEHQEQANNLTKMYQLDRFNINKIFLSAYEEVPGGRGRIVPAATQTLIDQINRGTLIVNYTGHGSPTQWAHEALFSFERD
ncbi:MAG: hypothetical protein GY808_11990, partial [Gammaproteobacteria bacterium]|nr:hypothetical protein [Gammaproteobacteria bacterium]